MHEHDETESLVEERDISEIPPPKHHFDYKQTAIDYVKGLKPYCLNWIPKYNRKKLQGKQLSSIKFINLILQGMLSQD
jgi:hypothetical protein